MKRFIGFFLFFVLLVSCHPLPQLDYSDHPEPETWAELFDVYWERMSTSYLFWDSDYSSGKDWNSVKSTYRPLFEELGSLDYDNEGDASQSDSTREAVRYFCRIMSGLSDNHHQIQIGDVLVSRYMLGLYGKAGLSEDEIVSLLMGESQIIPSEKMQKLDVMTAENASSIISISLGLPDGSGTLSADDGLIPEKAAALGFSSLEYFQEDEFSIVLGRTVDGVLYLALSDFSIESHEGAKVIAEHFRTQAAASDTSAVVIDLRGCGGGSADEIAMLFSPFVGTGVLETKIGETRRKAGDGMTDYTPWIPLSVYRDTSASQTKAGLPIALIVNGTTGSVSEWALLLFKALSGNGRCALRIFGEETAGMLGFCTGSSALSSGVSISMAAMQVRGDEGRVREGRGVAPDEEIPFSYDAFLSGDDSRLLAALEWASSR